MRLEQPKADAYGAIKALVVARERRNDILFGDASGIEHTDSVEVQFKMIAHFQAPIELEGDIIDGELVFVVVIHTRPWGHTYSRCQCES